MRALPHAYRNVSAPVNTIIKVTVSTGAGGNWYLINTDRGWQLTNQVAHHNAHTSILFKPDITWKLLTKAITPPEAQQNSVIKGDAVLATQVFNMLSVMA